MLAALVLCSASGTFGVQAQGQSEAQVQAQVQTDVTSQMPVLLELRATDTGLALEFDGPVKAAVRHLDNPPRLLVELPEVIFAFDTAAAEWPQAVVDVRFGRIGPGQSRIVFTFGNPHLGTLGEMETGDDEGGALLPLALLAVEPAAFAARTTQDAEQQSGIVAPKADRAGGPAAPDAGRPFTLVIDPGHGGIDGGAEGKLGTVEKDVVLAFALKLRNALEGVPDLRVVMTRDSDTFVGLRDRVKTARQNEADLMMSIHADSIGAAGLRGATVYTLSDSASDAISKALAEQENLADSIAGLPVEQADPGVNDILVDLLRRETETFSRTLASELVVHLEENGVELINNPLRAAGFRVLTAPDVPSLLLEIGYLSNLEDERLMKDEAWRLRTAAIIADAVKIYARNHKVSSAAP
ncbi:MAG: N-acetylmuramoyl-L-alanine amidase [Phyllobacteriaceae bacterium]|nr:N-acetylmuramoyl-L-alanine amidase [Phyllobacteriaceae bacterium]